jgi:hypothetical protein
VTPQYRSRFPLKEKNPILKIMAPRELASIVTIGQRSDAPAPQSQGTAAQGKTCRAVLTRHNPANRTMDGRGRSDQWVSPLLRSVSAGGFPAYGVAVGNFPANRMDRRTAVKRTLEVVESLTGCLVQVVQDPSVKNMARLDIAPGPCACIESAFIRISPTMVLT